MPLGCANRSIDWSWKSINGFFPGRKKGHIATRLNSLLFVDTRGIAFGTVSAIDCWQRRSRKQLTKTHTDNGYGHRTAVPICSKREISSRIARRGIDMNRRLGCIAGLWRKQCLADRL